MWSKIYFICTFLHLEILNYPVTLENKINKQQQKPLKVKRDILAQITENKYIFYLVYISEKQSLLNQISVLHSLPWCHKNISKLSKDHHTLNPDLDMIY